MADVVVRPVSSESDLQAFLRMPWTVYKDDPIWSAPLWSEHVKFFDPAHNVELRHIDHQKFVAWRGDTPVGTVIAFVNHAYNEFQEENAGWFGQFELLDDREAGHVLRKAAEDWVRSKGVGCFAVTRSLSVPTASTLSIHAQFCLKRSTVCGSLSQRSVSTASATVKGTPSCHLTSSRSVNSRVSVSTRRQDFASKGCTSPRVTS
jgi:hypothetical protein